MLLTIDATNRIAERAALRAMFAARKSVFVDLLRWELPVLDDRYEIDQFDDGHAIYLMITDGEGRHLASARLLPTMRPSLLDTLFPQLCAETIPHGPDIFEITRFCLSRDLRAATRRRARDALVTALARFALERGISRYTGVAEQGWLDQILAFGWECRTLGGLRAEKGRMLGALTIAIAPDTLDRLAAAGIADAGEARLLDRAA